MAFNSWEFVLFFLGVWALYLLIPKLRFQNALLLVASYWFYGVWDWRFLSLLFASTILDYFCALRIHASEDPSVRKRWLVFSMSGNLVMLCFFKYFGFFIASLEPLLLKAGIPADRLHLDIVLPVGISFYTFQTMSYAIDVYRRELVPTRRFFDFALFVTFFPQLVAGPIERATNLLPQCLKPRTLDRERFVTGAWLVVWGLWKKIVIADNMAPLADAVFNDSAGATASMAYLGVVAFAFQIYCDFSAYSDIARGTARLMGFELMLNFDNPYFAVNPSDFWRRWHISLSTWLRDYLYIPLGGNRGSEFRTYRNLALTMLLGGLWHGAAWNFVWWGAFHGVLLIGHRLITGRRTGRVRILWNWQHLLSMFVMFHFTLGGWLLFRSTRRVEVDGRWVDDSWAQMMEMLGSAANGWGFDAAAGAAALKIAAFALPLLAVQWVQERRSDYLWLLKLGRPWRVAVGGLLVWSWLVFGVQAGEAFIYFQF